jgi:carbamoyl-phosphate synthase large subunit
MPKDPQLNKILLIGAGPIVIAQAGEFDYAGTQACKALKEEGCSVVLINPNPASIMTDLEMADATYLEPLVPEIMEKILAKEQPDAILTTMGGQTALNCSLQLEDLGILQKYNVRLIGASSDVVRCAEDRMAFRQLLDRIGLDHPQSIAISQIGDLYSLRESLLFPILIRTSFTLGGTGSGIAENWSQLVEICQRALQSCPKGSIQLEESLHGWKEFELEVMVDSESHFIVICAIENFDPMGIHTGDSITIAPAQTLTDQEYQKMRNAARLLIQALGMTSGGCNVQFAIHPTTGRMVVIEINPRVSRSSALASKATGFPIARVATKIALGYLLHEIKHPLIGRNFPVAFEPTLDYVITKIPQFNFNKFPATSPQLNTQMKSIGEAMGIGSTFQESLQKTIRSMENGRESRRHPFRIGNKIPDEILISKLKFPEEDRLFYLLQALRQGWHIEKIYELTSIDRWFLSRLQTLIEIENQFSQVPITTVTHEELLFLKQNGFSDAHLSEIFQIPESQISDIRSNHHIHPAFHYIDSCAAEFPVASSYLYSTYWGANEPSPLSQEKIVIIGSGPNRIGQGIEFDYCCVHASLALRELGVKSVIINCNPETVSTDHDCCDRLYFEPLTYEDIREILTFEKPDGLFLQFSGQTGILLSQKLVNESEIKILGTSPATIKLTENRLLFSNFLDTLRLPHPPHCLVTDFDQAEAWVSNDDFPLLIRSSFAIGGQNFMKIQHRSDLEQYFSKHSLSDQPLLLEKYICDAIEVDVDALSDGKEVFICGVIEQLDPAGIHSGDSAAVFPCRNLSASILEQIEETTKVLAQAMEIKGIFNVQYLIKEEQLFILEVNPRASRTVPFLSKALHLPLIKMAVQILMGTPLASVRQAYPLTAPQYCFIKTPIFSFDKLHGVDRTLGLEMKSTGEAIAIGRNFEEALQKSKAYTSTNTNGLLSKCGIYSLQEINKMKGKEIYLPLENQSRA